MFGSHFYLKGCNVIAGHWLLSDEVAPKESFLATYSPMSNPHSTRQGAVAPKRAVLFLIFCSSTFEVHHSWNRLVHDMIDIFHTFLWHYFLPPELLDSIHKFPFVTCFTFDSKKKLSSCHKSSIRFRLGLSVGVPHQLMLCYSKKACAHPDMCFRTLSCMNWWSGSFSQLKSTRVDSRMLQKGSAPMMLSKMQISAAPCLLIPAQTRTLRGCFGFGVRFIGSSNFL